MMKSLRHIMAVGGPLLALSGLVPAITLRADEPLSHRSTAKVHPATGKQALASSLMSRIQVYLKEGRVLTRQQIDEAPYIVAGQDGRVLFASGDTIYVRDPAARLVVRGQRYGLYRSGKEYLDPQTGERLGYEARRLGTAVVSGRRQQVVALRIEHSLADIRLNDRLFPLPARQEHTVLVAHAAENRVSARIIRFFDRISSVARYDVVVINRGERDGVKPGVVLGVYRPETMVDDPRHDEKLPLPRRKVGQLLLYRVFDKVSYGLVTQSTQPIYRRDVVESPQNDN